MSGIDIDIDMGTVMPEEPCDACSKIGEIEREYLPLPITEDNVSLLSALLKEFADPEEHTWGDSCRYTAPPGHTRESLLEQDYGIDIYPEHDALVLNAVFVEASELKTINVTIEC